MRWFNKDEALIPTTANRYASSWVDPNYPRYCETNTLVYRQTVTAPRAPKLDAHGARTDFGPRSTIRGRVEAVSVASGSGASPLSIEV